MPVPRLSLLGISGWVTGVQLWLRGHTCDKPLKV